LKQANYKPPFPWFGGKSSVADAVWKRFGDVRNYVEPFAGSAAMLMLRPQPFIGTETINDADGFVSNFWRATRLDPEAVAFHADWPVNENDLHARHAWLVGQRESLTARLEGDADWFDAKIAGWWCWGSCCWIGSGFCSGDGPWQVVDGELVNTGNAGRGVNRKRPHLGNAGRGVNRQRPHLGDAGQGGNRQRRELTDVFAEIAERLENVRVCCGDWSRVCGPTPTVKMGLTGVFLDPPYADTAKRTARLYAKDCLTVAHAVKRWAVEWGNDPRMRIALCGYEGEHDMPAGWDCVEWKAPGGYGSQGEGDGRENAKRERIWYSRHCVREDMGMFSELSGAA